MRTNLQIKHLLAVIGIMLSAASLPAPAAEDAKLQTHSYEVIFGNEPPQSITLEAAKAGEPCTNANLKSSANYYGQPNTKLILQRCADFGNRAFGELYSQGELIKFVLDIAAGERMVFGEKATGPVVAVIRRTN
jgi:hypothetical protein